MAYLARYANQQAADLMRMRLPDLRALTQAVSNLLAEENARMGLPSDGGAVQDE